MTENQTAERWHRVTAEVIWTDDGKFGVRFFTPDGHRVTQHFDEMPPGLAGCLERCK